MYDVDKLEKIWIKYNRKRLLTPFLILIFLLLITFVLLYIFFGHRNEGTHKTTILKNKITLDTNNSKMKSPNKVRKIIFDNATVGLKKHSSQRHSSGKLKMVITDRKKGDIVSDIKSRFKYSHDKKDSLFLAKYYYDKKKYKDSEKWALETNKIDNTLEGSWLIFAKSLAKQGERVKALKVLDAYYKKTSSRNARTLIGKIRQGKSY